MQQHLHLLVVDCQRRTALAATYGCRYLLPSIACAERARATVLAARWCAERGIGSDIAGQWLGRMTADATDWLIAIPAADRCPPQDTQLEWIGLDALANGNSVLDYQTWALRRVLEQARLPSVTGPFGSLDWPKRVRKWMATSLGLVPSAWTPHRAGANETVLGLETPRGRVYFKGLAADRAAEASLTRQFGAAAPDAFAETIALDERSDGSTWWVSAECAGRPAHDGVRVAVALARIQQRLRSIDCTSHVLARPDLPAAFEWAGQDPDDIGSLGPDTWIPMDLDPNNVLDDDGQVTFIDLDESYLGPAPLAMAGFALRLRDQHAAAYLEYAQSWSPPLAAVDWPLLERTANVFQAWRGWMRVRQNVERGELHADLEALESKIRARLSRNLQRR
jgi:hypothetical protein